jgi:hypothetical protein
MNTNDRLLTLAELAHILGVRTYQITYAHQQQLLPEPPRVAGRRVYGSAEVEAARRYVADHAVAGRRRGRPTSLSS